MRISDLPGVYSKQLSFSPKSKLFSKYRKSKGKRNGNNMLDNLGSKLKKKEHAPKKE